MVVPSSGKGTAVRWSDLVTLLTSNPMYIAVVVAFAALVLLCVVLIMVCAMRR